MRLYGVRIDGVRIGGWCGERDVHIPIVGGRAVRTPIPILVLVGEEAVAGGGGIGADLG